MKHKLQLINPKTNKYKKCEGCGAILDKSRICLEDPSKKRYICIACVVNAYTSLDKETWWQRTWKQIAFRLNWRKQTTA